MGTKKKKSEGKLFEIAERQHGYFTARQATTSGYHETNHPYHVRAGNWIREERGIYRLARYPGQERPDLMKWYLWSRNRSDVPQGVYSHETAFSIFEISDLMPAKLHMTVPPKFRRSTDIPNILQLHYSSIDDSDCTKRFGVKVTRPLKTVIDLIETGETERTFIKQGFVEALKTGLITKAEIRKAKISDKVRRQLDQWDKARARR